MITILTIILLILKERGILFEFFYLVNYKLSSSTHYVIYTTILHRVPLIKHFFHFKYFSQSNIIKCDFKILEAMSLPKESKTEFEFKIRTTWDDRVIQDHEPIELNFTGSNDSLFVNIKAKYFGDINDKPVGWRPGDFFNLWDYEVVEAFFMSDSTGKYLEVEFGPYGHYVVLLLSGSRNVVNV